jgi:hypothetical protein
MERGSDEASPTRSPNLTPIGIAGSPLLPAKVHQDLGRLSCTASVTNAM